MIEKTFVTQLNDKNFLKQLKNRLVKCLCNCEGIITEMQDYNDYYLLIAYDNQFNDLFEKLIKDEIIQFFCYYKKLRYFRENLKLEKVNKLLSEAFIRALVRYDQNIDIKEISSNYSDFSTINLESYFNFCLPNLKTRWKEIVTLTNENAVWLLSQNSFEELLKFLIANLDTKLDEMHIVIESKSARVFDNNNELILEKKIKCKNIQMWLMASLIKFAPNKIIITNNSNNQNLDWIEKFFCNKIQFCNAK